MPLIECAHCGNPADPETTSGVCPLCGRRLKDGRLPGASAPTRPQRCQTAGSGQPSGKGPGGLKTQLGFGLILSVIFLAVPAGLLGFFFTATPPEWLLVGGGVVIFSVAYGVMVLNVVLPARWRLRQPDRGGPSPRTSWQRRIAVLLPALPAVVGWFVLGGMMLQRHWELARVVNDVAPLLKQAQRDPQLPSAVRGQVLIWDVPSGCERRGVQRQLPSEMQVRSRDEPITLVAILKVERQLVTRYERYGIDGYRQTARVRVVGWPDGKVMSTHAITGKGPPATIYRDRNSSHAEVGDLDGPLADWVKALPREDSPAYRELVAQVELVAGCTDQFREMPDLLGGRPPAALRPNLGLGRGGEPPLPRVPGKFLVWNWQEQCRSPVQDLLPAELRATSADRELTLVVLLLAETVEVRRYTDGAPGYRRVLTVGLLKLPEKKWASVHTVLGNDPPLLRIGGKVGPVYGEIDRPLAEWIQRLPRARPRE